MENKELEFFKKLRDVSSDIVNAIKSEDVKELESAMGRFLYLMVQAEALK
ncbi:hypothetical protein [Gracilibacillus alcaliphilus]|nr:hypothetical protein [Gracilibacillus alcaliphilus]MBM7678389.1 hypothetical protein [Gracilibacillus alcaliphilus]